jgi:hypothetical protein
MNRIRLLKGSVFTIAVTGGLVFGTAQAFATPQPQQSATAYCEELACAQSCGGYGFCHWWGGCICM